MARYEHLAFVCTNERDPSDPRGSCHARSADALLDRLKELTHEHKLKGKVRVVGSSCLNYCDKGCAAVIFSEDPAPEETWYTHLQPKDADALFQNHLQQGVPLEPRVEPQDGD